MNVFVLCTGRCGSVTFAEACKHFTNYTTDHESRGNYLGSYRVLFPPNHIEVDLRLAFHTGLLEEHYGQKAFYVHLTRDPAAVIASYRRKWEAKGKKVAGLVGGWRLINQQPIDAHMPLMIEHMINTINSNIRAFLRDKGHMTIDLATAKEQFPEFARRIGGAGDIDAACREFDIAHNASAEAA